MGRACRDTAAVPGVRLDSPSIQRQRELHRDRHGGAGGNDAERTRRDDAGGFCTPEAESIRGRYRASLDWHILDGGIRMMDVPDESGRLVDGGLGDDPEAAPLEVYERLIPSK